MTKFSHILALMGGQADRISDNPNHKRGFNQCRRSLHKFGDKSSLVHRFHIFFCTLISKCNQTCSGLRGLGETKRRKSEQVVNLRMAVVENIPLIHRAATPMVTQVHQPGLKQGCKQLLYQNIPLSVNHDTEILLISI